MYWEQLILEHVALCISVNMKCKSCLLLCFGVIMWKEGWMMGLMKKKKKG